MGVFPVLCSVHAHWLRHISLSFKCVRVVVVGRDRRGKSTAFEAEASIALLVRLAKSGSIRRVVQGVHGSIEGHSPHLLAGPIEHF